MKKNTIIALLILTLLLAAGIIGYQLNNDTNSNDSNKSSDIQKPTEKLTNSDISKLISFNTPTEWREKSCDEDGGSVYFATTNSAEVDCSASPELQVKLSAGSEEYSECSQIPEKQNVKKFICISKYINDLRSLQTDTEYLSSSAFGRETEVQTFYIDTGSAIIKAEYIHSGSDTDQAGFDSLVNSIKAK